MQSFGPTRILFSTKNYNIKVPKLNLKYHCKKFRENKNDKDRYSKLLYEILKGVKINYLECNNQAYIEKYIATTKVSIFGFLNIQEKLEVEQIGVGTIKGIIYLINQSDEFNSEEKANILNLLHGKSNYGIDKRGDIKIINNGIKEVQEFLKKYGDSVINEVVKIINAEKKDTYGKKYAKTDIPILIPKDIADIYEENTGKKLKIKGKDIEY